MLRKVIGKIRLLMLKGNKVGIIRIGMGGGGLLSVRNARKLGTMLLIVGMGGRLIEV
jgi:hypothetical protein